MNQRKGIIVKSIDYKDYSKLIYLINEDGLDTLLVKGAKKPRSRNFAYSQILTKINYLKVETKTFDILTTGQIINNYSNIKEDILKTKYAYQVMELSYQFANHIEDKQLFYTFLDEILTRMNDSQYSSIFELVFRLKLLYLLGVGPIFSRCIVCNSRENIRGFSLYHGGSKCFNCIEQTDQFYRDDIIEFVKLLYTTKLEFFTEEFLALLPDIYSQINDFLNIYYNHFLGYTSKVAKVFGAL